MAQSAEKNIKERSSLYPMFSIKEIVDFINEIVKIGGKRVSINTIASVLGFSVKTNSFRAKISTAKQFGLIRGSNGAVELTELAKRIVYPVNELDTRRAIVESFYSQKLFEHFYTCGMVEGRRASENFDVSVYKANNPDLAAVFGDDLKAYYTHYVQSGQLENRVCK